MLNAYLISRLSVTQNGFTRGSISVIVPYTHNFGFYISINISAMLKYLIDNGENGPKVP